LFQLITLDIWDHINRDIITYTHQTWAQVVIISWVWLGCFIFRGIFTGVIIQNFDRIADSIKQEKAEQELKSQKERMHKLKNKLDRELSKQHEIEESVSNLKTAMEGILASSGSLYESQASLLSTEGMEKMIKNIQKLIKESYGSSASWEKNVSEALKSLTVNVKEVDWPRDTLFKYFQTMQELQENMREFQELDRLATLMLLEMHES
jgi:cation channel sperm-associated protein 2